jgi:hypothetical protein
VDSFEFSAELWIWDARGEEGWTFIRCHSRRRKRSGRSRQCGRGPDSFSLGNTDVWQLEPPMVTETRTEPAAMCCPSRRRSAALRVSRLAMWSP